MSKYQWDICINDTCHRWKAVKPWTAAHRAIEYHIRSGGNDKHIRISIERIRVKK
jgi:hypothetical protein